MNKPRLAIFQQRASLSTSERISSAQAIFHHWQSAKTHWPNSQHIGCYLPVSGEVDTALFLREMAGAGKTCYLPRLNDDAALCMVFAEYKMGDPLVKNRFGILEPLPEAGVINACDLDIVFTPLVVFDKRGYRLGMGQGYYDRVFAFLQQTPRAVKPVLIGLAYAFQEVELVEVFPWEVGVNAGVTEERVREFFW